MGCGAGYEARSHYEQTHGRMLLIVMMLIMMLMLRLLVLVMLKLIWRLMDGCVDVGLQDTDMHTVDVDANDAEDVKLCWEEMERIQQIQLTLKFFLPNYNFD